jgi:alkylhydroperoxidase family enzyme
MILEENPRVTAGGLRALGPRTWLRIKATKSPAEAYLLGTLGRSRPLFRGHQRFETGLVTFGRLPRDAVDLIAARTAANVGSPHLVTRRPANVPEHLRGWPPRVAALLQAVDDLHVYRMIAEDTWQRLAEFMDEALIVEVCLLTGYFETTAMFLRSALGVAPRDLPSRSAGLESPLPIGERAAPPVHALTSRIAGRLAGLVIGSGRMELFSLLGKRPAAFWPWTTRWVSLMARGGLRPAEIEPAILRTGWNCGSSYEWEHHVDISHAARIPATTLESIAAGPDDPAWNPRARALLRAVDELCTGRVIGDDTWRDLAAFLTLRQRTALCLLVGDYAMLAMVLNSFGVRGKDPGAWQHGLLRVGRSETDIPLKERTTP